MRRHAYTPECAGICPEVDGTRTHLFVRMVGCAVAMAIGFGALLALFGGWVAAFGGAK